LHDVLSLYPELQSVALVPVGVSAFSNEETMRSHTPGEAQDVIDLADHFQMLTGEILGRVSVFASDEFYLVAGLTPPPATKFESLDQAENGIGLVAAFIESFVEQTEMAKLGTGFFQSVDGAPALGYRAPRGGDHTIHYGYDDVKILTVKNDYFGGNIKVAGLLTGQDLNRALEGISPSTVLLLPDVCLSEGRFLDGLELEDLTHPVITIRTTGQDLRSSLESVRTKGLVST
jgi:NifB/MoaA-like Fe-S oxidoreductase